MMLLFSIGDVGKGIGKGITSVVEGVEELSSVLPNREVVLQILLLFALVTGVSGTIVPQMNPL